MRARLHTTDANEGGFPVAFLGSTACIWLVLMSLFGCASALRPINPIEALFRLTPLYAAELFVASIGIRHLLECFRNKRTSKICTYKAPIKLLLCFSSCFAIAVILECTVFQYNHYGALFADECVSTEDATTNWSTLRMAKMTAGSEELLSVDYYFSLVDAIAGTKEEMQSSLEIINGRGLRTPENSMDDEYVSSLAETEAIASEQGVEYAYPLPLEYDDDMAVAKFNNLNVSVSSIYVEPLFLGDGNILTNKPVNSMTVVITYADEDSSLRQTEEINLVQDMDYTWYIPLYSVGKVSELSVCFVGGGAAFSVIKLNEPIPLTPVLLRMLVVAIVALTIYLLRGRNVFSIAFDAKNKHQKMAFVAMLVALFCYCLVMAVFTIRYRYEDYSAGQYNQYLVDSILEGRLELDIPTSPEFEAIDRKYDSAYWSSFYGIEPLGDKVHWDTVFFEGKWYTYFGVVPALLLFVPYKLVTGNYLPYSAGCFIQGYVAILFLLLIWRWFFKKYLSNLPFVVYMLTSVALAFCSFVPFLLRRSFFYETVNLGGLMFCVLGFWLLLRHCDKSDRHNLVTLFFSCLCFALAVGCRPIMLLSSLLVPLFLWPEFKLLWRRGGVGVIKLMLCVLVPYMAVAIPIMLYNNARFGSPFDFGSTYQVTVLNIDVQHLLNPMGKIYRMLTGVTADLFNAPELTTTFPYADVKETVNVGAAYVPQYLGAIGLLTTPISWFLLGWIGAKAAGRERPLIGRFVIASLLVCIVTAVLSSDYSIQPRYEADYAWLVALASLASLLPLYERHRRRDSGAYYLNRLVAVACLVTIVLFFFLSFRGGISTQPGSGNMSFYYYVARSFSFFQGI